MAGLILDYDGRAFNTQRDIVLFIRECMDAEDATAAQAFRDTYRAVTDQVGADMTLAVMCGWAYRLDATKAAAAIALFGVEASPIGAQAPAAATQEVWEAAADGGGTPGSLEEQIAQGLADAEAAGSGDV